MKKEIIEKILKFRNDRDWEQFHNGKDLTISLSLEVNELLEIFQWSGNDLYCEQKLDKIEEELADVFIYATLLAECYGLDIDQIITNKLEVNNQKYPVDRSKGRKDKYSDMLIANNKK